MAQAEGLEAGARSSLVFEARRVAALTGALVVVTGMEELGRARTAVLREVEEAFDGLPLDLVWLAGRGAVWDLSVAPEHMLKLAYPSRDQRFELWSAALAASSASPGTASRLAGGFLLSEGQIEKAVREAVAEARRGGTLEEALTQAARRQAATGLGALAVPQTCNVGLDSLILEASARTQLEQLIAYVRHRGRLGAEWGFESRMAYGLGVVALFSGPPGTGKTLAATAIAKELDQELYRVDLSQLVSKYIGETEKHLASIFDAAEEGEVVLLFDEADSLFGKRTEVKSSVDRYANLEVNYLLQRIESFKGIVILTTNFEAGLDTAFARRIRFQVAFEAPGEQARRELWRLLIPSAVPMGQDVDLGRLAKDYELSGGHIKEVVLRAASLAMETGRPMTQSQLRSSAGAEYRKLGKLLPQGEQER